VFGILEAAEICRELSAGAKCTSRVNWCESNGAIIAARGNQHPATGSATSVVSLYAFYALTVGGSFWVFDTCHSVQSLMRSASIAFGSGPDQSCSWGVQTWQPYFCADP